MTAPHNVAELPGEGSRAATRPEVQTPPPVGHCSLSFTVVGTPVSQGSHRGFVVNGRAVVTNDNKRTKPWRQDIIAAALEALCVGVEDEQGMAERVGFPFGTGPVEVQVTFVMPRPKAHYRTGRHADELRDNAPVFCATKPDLDKLQRNLGDALVAAGVVRDDAQISVWQARKVLADPGEQPGAHIFVMAAS